jgi:hypothetical protein
MTGERPTVLDKVRALIERLAPEVICDECIARTLELGWVSHANVATRELAGSNGFARRQHMCSMCGAVRTVTGKQAR